jgi:hypothetical protein
LREAGQSLNGCEAIERAGGDARRVAERPRHRLRVVGVEVFPDLPETPQMSSMSTSVPRIVMKIDSGAAFGSAK